MSVITRKMITVFAEKSGISLIDGTQEAGIMGTLSDWEAGRGEMDAWLTDHPDTREVFAPLRTAYFQAQGVPEPAHSVLTGEVKTQD